MVPVKKNESAKMTARSTYSTEEGGRGILMALESDVAIEAVRSLVVLGNC